MNIARVAQSARKYAIALVLILPLVAVGGFAATRLSSSTRTYQNDAYHFSIRIPKTYTISESAPQSPYETIVFSHGFDSVQLTLSLWPDMDSGLTKESVTEQYPFTKNAEAFAVASGVLGLAMHNNSTDLY